MTDEQFEKLAEAIRAEGSKPELESPFVSPGDMPMEEITDAEADFLLKMMEQGRGKPSAMIGRMLESQALKKEMQVDTKGEMTMVETPDPGDQHDILPPGTTLIAGDEFSRSTGEWCQTGQAGDIVGIGDLEGITYRRKRLREYRLDWKPEPDEPAKPEQSDMDTIEALEMTLSFNTGVFSNSLETEIKAVIAIAKRAIQPPEVTEAEALARVKPPTNILSNCPDCGEFRGHGHECRPTQSCCVHCGVNPAVGNMVACEGCWKYAVDRVGLPGETPYKSLQGTKVGTVKITPVESPNDWVTARPEIDQRRYTTTRGKTSWADAKDLPPQPSLMSQQYGEQRQVNRVAVELIAIRDNRVIWREHGHTLFPGERLIYPDGNGGWCIGIPK